MIYQLFLIYIILDFDISMKIGINGFGRIGRLVLRILWERKDIEKTHINEINGDSLTASHLLEFDSVHGKWNKKIAVLGWMDNNLWFLPSISSIT